MSFIPGGGGATRPLLRDETRRNSVEIEQSVHAPSFVPEIKDRRSSTGTKDGALEWLRCGTIQKKVRMISISNLHHDLLSHRGGAVSTLHREVDRSGGRKPKFDHPVPPPLIAWNSFITCQYS